MKRRPREKAALLSACIRIYIQPAAHSTHTQSCEFLRRAAKEASAMIIKFTPLSDSLYCSRPLLACVYVYIYFFLAHLASLFPARPPPRRYFSGAGISRIYTIGRTAERERARQSHDGYIYAGGLFHARAPSFFFPRNEVHRRISYKALRISRFIFIRGKIFALGIDFFFVHDIQPAFRFLDTPPAPASGELFFAALRFGIYLYTELIKDILIYSESY